MKGRLASLLGMGVLLALLRRLGRGGPDVVEGREPEAVDPSEREVRRDPRAERLVAGLLLAVVPCAGAFIAFYALGADTQLLGLSMGAAFALLAAAAIVAAHRVVPHEVSQEQRPPSGRAPETEEVADIVAGGGEGVSRRGLLIGAAGVAGASVGAALIAPVASLGPRLKGIHQTPWHRGRRLVDTDGRPYLAADIEVGAAYTALPEGATDRALGAGLVVVRLPVDRLRLPAGRREWAPQGILAFSKICPHAGCAVSLYRYPLYQPTSRSPALVCPCHYSTFDPATGGRLLFGPAGRNLPQLPLMIDGSGHLRAAGPFPEDVGPSWWDVRRGPA